ncbi:putative integral membrane protein TIGR02587 [Catalinimonas alkaloidigena]|uniref:Putative integral membrane protein TIGR02587 n=1 Tax=Catalinimonas alkaloidigena TaxID=1075417 RepID=A0A1G9IT19_9BACT|nr:TIGR02587 family membrane protein [Catalinimonas alkaloidigena]SDL28225.1 putative integral membrane protein TIGR02587 [Catalinimonas alkaloidigena]
MRPLADSFKEYGRGIVGGFLFSLPMLYTMEVWQTGFIIQPPYLICYMVAAFGLLLGYNRFAGMRPESTWQAILIDSVEEMGLGILLSILVLWLTGRIEFATMPLDQILGTVMVESMPVAIGISVGTAQLGVSPEEDEAPATARGEGPDAHPRERLGRTLTLATCGGVLVAANVAPTEEIIKTAYEIVPYQALLLLLFALVLVVAILYYVDFRGTQTGQDGPLVVDVLYESTLALTVAMALSALMLLFFLQLEDISLEMALIETVVLTVPAALGTSAARLLIK